MFLADYVTLKTNALSHDNSPAASDGSENEATNLQAVARALSLITGLSVSDLEACVAKEERKYYYICDGCVVKKLPSDQNSATVFQYDALIVPSSFAERAQGERSDSSNSKARESNIGEAETETETEISVQTNAGSTDTVPGDDLSWREKAGCHVRFASSVDALRAVKEQNDLQQVGLLTAY